MDEKTEVEQVIKDAEEAQARLNRMRKAFETNPEVAALNKEYSETSEALRELFKKQERIRERVVGKYTDDGAYPYYHPMHYGYKSDRTNIRPEFIQAIKEVAGSMSKLRNSDIEKIIGGLIDEDEKKAFEKVNVEIDQLREKEKATYAKLEALHKEKLGEQEKQLGSLFAKAFELKRAQTPQAALEKFRVKATSKESLDKIRQRAKEIREELDRQDKSSPK